MEEFIKQSLNKIEVIFRFLVYYIGIPAIIIVELTGLFLNLFNVSYDAMIKPAIIIGLSYLLIIMFIGLIWIILNIIKTYRLNKKVK
jgi:hypothetical protein